DYNDLILTCSTPQTDSEFVIYGKVSTYSGLCKFNPCYPFPWLVVDTIANLKELLKYPAVRTVLERLYPERIREVERPVIIRKPFPEPDPVPFIPMMIPLGVPAEEAQLSAKRLTAREQPSRAEMASPGALARAQAAPLASAAMYQIEGYVYELAKLKDKLHLACTSESRPGLLLRFVEYDRTTSELTGGPYTGTGDRQILGYTVTDEQGNYIFRFTRTLAEIAQEVSDVPAGGSLVTELRPDIIVQIVAGVGPSTGVLFESALYLNIPNLKRLDLCIPESSINPGPACQGGRAIQAIGNIFTLPGVGNTLDADGRITATHASGPKITRGAWGGRLDLFACFLAHPEVTHYTIRYRQPPAGAWSFVQEAYTHIYVPAIGDPASPLHRVGPFNTSLHVGGGAAQMVPAYKNIESDPNWVVTHRNRKAQLSSSIYASALYASAAGTVEFWLEGYDNAGMKVAAANDTIKLFVDNRAISGDIASISMGGLAPGECGLFNLPSPNAALTVRFRVDHPGGFLQSYGLSVLRGSATPVAVSDTTPPVQPLSLTYDEGLYGNFFFGTFNAVGPDGSGYVVAELQANSGAWLPAGKNFCAFDFEIGGTPRVTDGYGLASGYRLDMELIGISYSPPPGP
ncbi:MAG: hypothetical protein HY677_05180, partial [Chloroflexi bacterium]|nr:hypothetical protein [Chloroflexota bacterium]